MSGYREIPVRDARTASNNNNPYVHTSPVPPSSAAYYSQGGGIFDALDRCGKQVEAATRRVEIMADNLWSHFRISASLADAAMARVIQGTKVLANGGPDKLFLQNFGLFPGEKLLSQCACYISTSSGPVIGTLYISTKRLAFCSDYPMCHHAIPVNHNCIYYKVVVPLEQVSTVNPCTNRVNPLEKYIQIYTVDNYEFIFLGFISYDKALKTINEALQQHRYHSNGY